MAFSGRRGSAEGSALQNSIDTLYANIRFQDIDKSIRSLVITSSVPNEGKTTIAAALAEAMAKAGRRTLLMECDLHRRSLAGLLKVHARYGMFSVMSDQATASAAVIGTRVPNLFFLDAEPDIPLPTEVLGSERFARLLDKLERSFDQVIIDAPPVGVFVDAALLAAQTDATLLIVRENYAPREQLAESKAQLDNVGARILGVVMNDCASA